jgi:hypothetical protein
VIESFEFSKSYTAFSFLAANGAAATTTTAASDTTSKFKLPRAFIDPVRNRITDQK